MPELAVDNTQNENPFADYSIEQLVDLRHDLDAEAKSAAALERSIKKRRDQVDEILWKYHEDHPEVALIQGNRAKVKWSIETQYQIDAGMREQVRDWLFENGHPYLMTFHLNRASTDEFVRLHGELPPHVSTFDKRKVSCTQL